MNKNPRQREALIHLAITYGVPSHIIEGIVGYILDGLPPGGFVRAVLENDLMEAFGRADIENGANMRQIVSFLYNHAPTDCYGNSDKVTRWILEAEKTREAKR